MKIFVCVNFFILIFEPLYRTNSPDHCKNNKFRWCETYSLLQSITMIIICIGVYSVDVFCGFTCFYLIHLVTYPNYSLNYCNIVITVGYNRVLIY